MILGPVFIISYGWLRVSDSWSSHVSAAIRAGLQPLSMPAETGHQKTQKSQRVKVKENKSGANGRAKPAEQGSPWQRHLQPTPLVLYFIQWMPNEKCIRCPRQMGFWESMGFERELMIKPQIYALLCLWALFPNPKIFHPLAWSAMTFTWAVKVISSLFLSSVLQFYLV